MILEEDNFNNKKDKEQKKDLNINQNEYKEEIDKDQVIKEDFSVKLEEFSKKIEDLENMKAIYEEKIEDLEKQSRIAEEVKQDYQNRFIKLEESREEYKKRGEKLENARNTFKVLSNELEEKKAELDKRDQYLKKNKKELILKENKLKEIEESLNKNIKKFTKSADEFGVRSNKNNITKSINSLPIDPYLEDEDFKQMEKGKVDVLKDILEELLFQGDFQSSFLIDGQGMIISEYSKTELDSLAVGAMFSLVCTTVLRTVQSLSLNELEYFKLSSLNGEFLLRNIEIKNYERNFILLAYYNESNSNIPVKKQVLSKKIIKKILKDLKRDFYDSRRGSGISWVFDNISEKLDFLKQKYNTIDGDIDLIRLNLVNKASIKIRELFEM
jgi:predicted regulator of Ras-like GTPase activity (Roadblock/LC7/MglB family)